jgi:hypothetical protein
MILLVCAYIVVQVATGTAEPMLLCSSLKA